MRPVLLAALPVLLLTAQASDDAAKEYARFDGIWKFASIHVAGKSLPAEAFKDSRLILRGNRWTLKEADSSTGGTYKVDVSRKPRHIDVTFTEGPEKGKTMLGIYELDGDTYRVCFALGGKDRPTAFASKPGSQQILEVLKRQKAKGEQKPAAPKQSDDFTGVDLQTLGIKPVQPTKDAATGFVVGGKNATALIRKLTEIAGRTVPDLERDMRPGRSSSAGFLGKNESLLDVLAADNRCVVDELGLTHQELARHLHLAGAIAVTQGVKAPKLFTYHGRRYKVQGVCYRGFVDSPFKDGTKTNCEATLWNLDNGKNLSYSLLLPYLIERYGFYEGHGTRFRVEPRAVLAVFDFLRKDQDR
jgi:uncharacterized protein (TIGR03067 family)